MPWSHLSLSLASGPEVLPTGRAQIWSPRTPSTAPCSVKAKVLWSSTPWAKLPDPIGPNSGSTRHPVRFSEVVSWTTRTVDWSKHCRAVSLGETLLQGGGPHPLVGQEAIDPFGLAPAARGLRDGIARPLRERFQDAGQAGRKPFVRQHRSRCHPRCPECVRMHSASPTRYQNVLSAAPFLLSTPYPLSRSRSSQKLWVMLRSRWRGHTLPWKIWCHSSRPARTTP